MENNHPGGRQSAENPEKVVAAMPKIGFSILLGIQKVEVRMRKIDEGGSRSVKNNHLLSI